MEIKDLINSGANISLNVNAADLLQFGEFMLIAGSTKQKLISDAKELENTFYTSEEAGAVLGVKYTTLWRWAKAKYLVPSKVGATNRYKKSDVDSILAGKRFDQ